MPTRSRPAALPLLPWQGPRLCICEEGIDRRVLLVVSIHGVEFFTNTGKSLAVDICSHGIRIKLATRPAPPFCEPVSFFEQRIRNRNRGFHVDSITLVIPPFKCNKARQPNSTGELVHSRQKQTFRYHAICPEPDSRLSLLIQSDSQELAIGSTH
jgi:hypothetical protein